MFIILNPFDSHSEPLSVTIHWKAVLNCSAVCFSIFEFLSILDLPLSGVKGLNVKIIFWTKTTTIK